MYKLQPQRIAKSESFFGPNSSASIPPLRSGVDDVAYSSAGKTAVGNVRRMMSADCSPLSNASTQASLRRTPSQTFANAPCRPSLASSSSQTLQMSATRQPPRTRFSSRNPGFTQYRRRSVVPGCSPDRTISTAATITGRVTINSGAASGVATTEFFSDEPDVYECKITSENLCHKLLATVREKLNEDFRQEMSELFEQTQISLFGHNFIGTEISANFFHLVHLCLMKENDSLLKPFSCERNLLHRCRCNDSNEYIPTTQLISQTNRNLSCRSSRDTSSSFGSWRRVFFDSGQIVEKSSRRLYCKNGLLFVRHFQRRRHECTTPHSSPRSRNFKNPQIHPQVRNLVLEVSYACTINSTHARIVLIGHQRG